ncbi:hypothetical protein C1I95_12420 [Micromonospora craterilacus]|uniref:Uncharacterized protein n=1 Tax=Micromonospora craterilacus TaxID=1655439 RepID=A0A2W2FBK7_9ACTN|nr:hypothetical protein [Micromonospora craterilacus]PZG18977.1 hypothetical protein C1I95_12420 [Micromonospora craterilacus]
MVIRLPAAVRSAACDAIVDLLDAGSGPGTIEIRTGSQPASAGDSATGTLLAVFTLADPAFGAAAAGVAALGVDPAPETVGVAAGTAGWWRAKDSTGGTVMDGSATVTGGGGDLTLNTVTVSIGLVLRLTGGTVTMPG